MPRKYNILSILVILLCLISKESLAGNRDFRVRTQMELSYEINETLMIHWRTGLRFRYHAKELFLQYSELALHWEPNESWIISPTYRQARKRIGKEWRLEGTPRLEISRVWKRCNWEFTNRNRLEYKTLSTNWFYRNRSKFEYIIKCSDLEFIPFISEELFVINGKKFKESRTTFGCLAAFSSSAYIELDYMLRYRTVSGRWDRIDELVAYFGYVF